MADFSVTVEVRPDNSTGLSDTQVDIATSLLTKNNGVLSTGSAGWNMVIIIDSANPLAASKRAHYLAMSIAKQAGFPPGEVVRIEAARTDVLDRERS